MYNFEDDLNEKIYDDIHGFVYLTKDEKNLLSNPYMQRLHHIRQNGLAFIVFPGATHTRFSHSIGVLYVAEKMIQRLKKINKIDIHPIDHQVIRLAAILHDVGHYPLSHTLEASYMEYNSKFLSKYSSRKKLNNIVKNTNKYKDLEIFKNGKFGCIHDFLCKIDKMPNDFFHHEQVGKRIITTKLNENIKAILDKIKGKMEQSKNKNIDYVRLIGDIVTGIEDEDYEQYNFDMEDKEKYYVLSQIIKSNLDSDQIDYMCRDTYNTGIQSSLRLDFILDNMDICFKSVKSEKIIQLCFNIKALQSIEQFLLSKFYWYSEILYYDKTYILNFMAQRLNTFMLLSDTSKAYSNKYNTKIKFEKLIRNPQEFFFFNDNYFFDRIKKIIYCKDSEINKISKLATRLINKNIPKSLNFDQFMEITKNIKSKISYFSKLIYQSEILQTERNFIKIITKANKKYLPVIIQKSIFDPRIYEQEMVLQDKNINISTCIDEKCAKYGCEKAMSHIKPLYTIDGHMFRLFFKKIEKRGKSKIYAKNLIKYIIYDFNKN